MNAFFRGNYVFALTLLALVMQGVSAVAAEVNWQKDLNTATKLAEQTQKPLMIQFTASWCGYCHKMTRETFRDEKVVSKINNCVVAVQVDFDANRRLANTLGVKALPTTVVILEANDVRLWEGYQSIAKFTSNLDKVCTVVKTPLPKAPDGPAPASLPPTPSTPKVSQTNGIRIISPTTSVIGFSGVCLVSLVDDQVLQQGSPGVQLDYHGSTLRFASDEYRRRFEENPNRYWPSWDGRCPVSMIDEKVRRQGDLRLAVIYKRRLVLLASEEHREAFAKSPEVYRQLADEQTAPQPTSAPLGR